MPPLTPNSVGLWPRAAYASIAAGLAFVMLFGVLAAWNDVVVTRDAVLHAEVKVLATQAERRVSDLETYLNSKYGRESEWLTLKNDPWVRDFWKGVTPLEQHALFAAVTNPSSTIILHTDPELEEKTLSYGWYDTRHAVAGVDVFELSGRRLSNGKHAFDVRIPIMIHGKEVAAYHEGLDAEWVQQQMNQATWGTLARWAIVIAGMLAAMACAAGAMLYIGNRRAALLREMRKSQLEQMMQIENLAAGLAHEIRNPLHAIRLNLHALARAWRGQTPLTDQDLATMIRESNVEIDRVERLMQELLGFAKPEAAKDETFSAGKVAKATVNFLREEMRRKEIDVATTVSEQPIYVRMDPARFRQVLINLLSNAREAVGTGGKIFVSLERRPGRAEIVVSDNGPGVDEEECERIFEPFYSTKNNGSGLGLALVRKFVEEVGGKVQCEANQPRGARFRLELPLARSPRSRFPQNETES
jgi:signal transduction histidine kinase